ncbi:hypothetical protein RUND412_005518 [Rhizina undulata]
MSSTPAKPLKSQDGLIAWIKRIRARMPPLDPAAYNLTGKTILITGSNTGLGLEAARIIVKIPGVSRIILAVRTIQKGEEAKKELLVLAKDGNKGLQIDVRRLDHLSFDSVREFVEELNGMPIHVAILNAGVLMDEREVSADGYDHTLQVNYLSTFFLSILLLPNLRLANREASGPSRLTIVASDGHYFAKFDDWDNPDGIINAINDESFPKKSDRYCTSKLLQILLVRELAKHVENDAIVNAVNPGAAISNIGRYSSKGKQKFLKRISRTADEGGRAIVHAAVATGKESHGQFLTEMAVALPSKFARSEKGADVGKRLADESFEVLEKFQAGLRAFLTSEKPLSSPEPSVSHQNPEGI